MRGIRRINTEGTKTDFSVKFDRLYATQRYVEAFDLCLQNIDAAYKDDALLKAKTLLPQIKRKIELSGKTISYDDVIDIFTPLHYKLKIQGNSLKVDSITFRISKTNGKTTITFIQPYLKYILVFGVYIFLLFIIEGFVGNLHKIIGIKESVFWPIAVPVMVFIAIVSFYCLYRRYYRRQRAIIIYFLKSLLK